jgi:hypothetical protein
LVESQSQTDARFRNNRLYTRISAAEVRRQLQKKKDYKYECPSEETIRCKLNKLGFHPIRVQKTQVKKKYLKQTKFSKKSNALEKKLSSPKTNF